jgi:hypothetical protein
MNIHVHRGCITGHEVYQKSWNGAMPFGKTKWGIKVGLNIKTESIKYCEVTDVLKEDAPGI